MKKLAFFMDQNSLQPVELVSDYVDCRVLAPSVAKTFTKPATARFCRLSAGVLFYYNATTTATVAAADIVNGSASISVPATVQPTFMVDDVASISVVAPTAAVVSAEWWS